MEDFKLKEYLEKFCITDNDLNHLSDNEVDVLFSIMVDRGWQQGSIKYGEYEYWAPERGF
jgi:hypothetical protein